MRCHRGRRGDEVALQFAGNTMDQPVSQLPAASASLRLPIPVLSLATSETIL
jgi:hypothetical protein